MNIDDVFEQQGDIPSKEAEVAALFDEVNRIGENCKGGIGCHFDVAAGYDGNRVLVYSSLTVQQTEDAGMYD